MNVLIVDDTPTNLKLMETLTRKISDGIIATTQIDPLEGLQWCEAHEVDLLIVDYMMPNLDGIEFIRRFRVLPGHDETPVLMVTADHERDTRYAALDAGATDFLNKPIDSREFRSRVRNMLALQQSRKEIANRAQWLEIEVAKRTEEIVARELEMIMRLSRAAEFRDPETGAHIQRMSNYSRLIAEQLGLSGEEQDVILKASPMHDIGKIAIPDHILLKPGKLTDVEFEAMKRHAEYGYEILKNSRAPLLDKAAIIARSHHEKFDGSGYPFGLKGDDIPLHGRIVAVADVFDALTTERPYKKPWEIDRALDFLRHNSSSHFDPSCVDAFLARIDDALAIQKTYMDDPYQDIRY
jgi:response regulator RpfG family c-di-GMP phosphodiesterase